MMAKKQDPMRVKKMAVATLEKMVAKYNPRKISAQEFESLRLSIREFGNVVPLLVNTQTNRIIAGHQRLRAAAEEGLKSLPVVCITISEKKERKLNLALNRIGGEWDEYMLAEVFQWLKSAGEDLEATGFKKEEVDRYMAGLADDPQPGRVDPDRIPDPPDKPVSKRGDLVKLGRHRLLCGDSAVKKEVSRLLGGAPIHLVYTDPPYNVAVSPRSNNAIAAAMAARTLKGDRDQMAADLKRHPGKSKPTGKMRPRDRRLENDFLPDDEFKALLKLWFGNLSAFLLPGRAFYLWGGYSNFRNYPAAIEDAGLYFSQCVVWHKRWPVLTRKDFMGDHEWCFYGWRSGAAHYFNPIVHNGVDVWTATRKSGKEKEEYRLVRDDSGKWFHYDPKLHNASDFWSVRKVSPPKMMHLTEKPVELATRALHYSSKPGENVMDLFAGSGSTVIAAEQMGRTAFVMELDPAYCDVIIQRWEEFAGKKAKRSRRKT